MDTFEELSDHSWTRTESFYLLSFTPHLSKWGDKDISCGVFKVTEKVTCEMVGKLREIGETGVQDNFQTTEQYTTHLAAIVSVIELFKKFSRKFLEEKFI